MNTTIVNFKVESLTTMHVAECRVRKVMEGKGFRYFGSGYSFLCNSRNLEFEGTCLDPKSLQEQLQATTGLDIIVYEDVP